MRWFRSLVFHLERFILRGAHYQLLLIAGLIILVSLVSGGILYLTRPEGADFWDWAWWGFLRLSDPGYLGEDEGLVRRTVSTAVTLLGYVLFMGALVAIMTQGLHRTISRLEAGLTPITESGHIVILGWTNRTPSIVREILLAEGRVKRFLRRVGTSSLRIVILAEEVSPSLVYDLKDELGPVWDASKVIFRSGNPLRLEHLTRTDFLNAAAIILPAGDLEIERSEAFDSKVMKILLVISNVSTAQEPPRHPPLVVTEIFDPRKTDLARNAYQGSVEIVPSAAIVSRLIAQNVRHEGLSHVYRELLSHGAGNEIYIRDCPVLAGQAFGGLTELFPYAIPLGVFRVENEQKEVLLNPPADFRLSKDDRIVFVARKYEETDLTGKEVAAGTFEPPGRPVQVAGEQRRVLILGWGSKLPVLLNEFASYRREDFSVDIMSVKSVTERETLLRRFGQLPHNLSVRQIEGDFTSPAGLAAVHLSEYSNIVFLANDWMVSQSETDARTILGFQLLRSELNQLQAKKRPRVLIELMDPENEPLFPASAGEVLVSPVIVSHMMGQIAMRPELRQVFEKLFTVGGAEIFFHHPGNYLEEGLGRVTFEDLQKQVAHRGNIALGLFRPTGDGGSGSGELCLNPPRDTQWDIREVDEVVVLTSS